jgi:hypothetical protein
MAPALPPSTFPLNFRGATASAVSRRYTDTPILLSTPIPPALRCAALTVKYRSLGSNRRSIRHSCKHKSEISSACSLEVKPTGKKSKEKGSQSSAAHLVERLLLIVCEGSRAAEKIVEGLCSDVCSNSMLTGIAIDIAYLYTYTSKSHSLLSPFGSHPKEPHNLKLKDSRAPFGYNTILLGLVASIQLFHNDKLGGIAHRLCLAICYMPAC